MTLKIRLQFLTKHISDYVSYHIIHYIVTIYTYFNSWKLRNVVVVQFQKKNATMSLARSYQMMEKIKL